ncbi:hypothetical protein ACES2L_09435 [Bdellovibrio bacteriovorus]
MASSNISQNDWTLVKAEIQKTWEGLSADELEQTHGDVHEIAELVHDRYGLDTDDAEKKLEDVIARCGTAAGSPSWGVNENYEQDSSDTESFGLPGPSGAKEVSASSEEAGNSRGSAQGSQSTGNSAQSQASGKTRNQESSSSPETGSPRTSRSSENQGNFGSQNEE